MRSFRPARGTPMRSGPSRLPVPVIAPAEEKPGSHVPPAAHCPQPFTLASGIDNATVSASPTTTSRRHRLASRTLGRNGPCHVPGSSTSRGQSRSPREARASACGGIIALGTSKPRREIQGKPGSEAVRLAVVRCQREGRNCSCSRSAICLSRFAPSLEFSILSCPPRPEVLLDASSSANRRPPGRCDQPVARSRSCRTRRRWRRRPPSSPNREAITTILDRYSDALCPVASRTDRRISRDGRSQ